MSSWKPYPNEFREDIVAIARRRDPRVQIRQIAADSGISESYIQNWWRQADVEDGSSATAWTHRMRLGIPNSFTGSSSTTGGR